MSEHTTGRSLPDLPEDYEPSEAEEFMNGHQLAYFRLRLLEWKENILKESDITLENLKNNSKSHPDIADRASSSTNRFIELRSRDRYRKLLGKIDAALDRIQNGTYGYCEESGEPIDIKRLVARPIATLTIEAQERHEQREKIFRAD